MKKIVVLISGSGSNLQSLIDATSNGLQAQIVAVISNQPDAYGLIRAQKAGIPALTLSAKSLASREEYDAALMAMMDGYQPDLVVLAGFMRILTADFVKHYAGKMLNIHPSLLPKYPGLHTHRKAIENGDSEHGTSVHFVTEELDGGPVILQAKVPIFAEDSEEAVVERVKAQEHNIYPLVVQWFIDDRLVMKDNLAYLDGQCLPPQGYANE
ncbi:phosphoribosylglycinamide formyltransferase [Providencia vermicola]|uniref:Phosphoribosylglycinamide formyltransferase n=2 Tax=Providencia TaxID=586 RepID=A0AAI9HWF8_PROST|nr:MULTISPECIES: phosphoribosylglycinamide formyltransferase [Providencia]ELR5043941.1 phosphoribosylglycinamide formyltransferase [Providencia rettgeri]ELR5033904.1 phosphoribosylglycinamide formyltransferase [Providencia stuartii]ELR5119730.1 phosphoribosylglycinamide formyltransferase [Providencia stuartii]ELR5141474.1 phosphoribosylglycinamide formyltransferase [Providencia stuartii]ELR5290832.1 phosphoribosylglycinamide formyltransferase [Providencia stuartii]